MTKTSDHRSLNQLFRELYKADFLPSAVELLTLANFWEMYPFHLFYQRNAITAAVENPDKIKLQVKIPAAPVVEISLKNRAGQVKGIDPQLVLIGEGLSGFSCGFQMITLLINGNGYVTPACFTAGDRTGLPSLNINNFELPTAQEDVEKILAPAFESRGLDSGALLVSGRLCRNICRSAPSSNALHIIAGVGAIQQTTSIGNNYNARWPQCLGSDFNKLHPIDLEQVLRAERELKRFKVKLELEKKESLRSTSPKEAKLELPPMTDVQVELFAYIKEHGPLTGKQICNHFTTLDESTFTKHHVPELKKHGVKNKRGAGYYI